MSFTTESVCNMALGHLKIAIQISALATDKSAQGLACRTFYDVTRQSVLSDFKWPFLTTIQTLALVSSSPFPDPDGNAEWTYAYQYPASCLNFKRVLSGYRNDDRQTRIPYKIFNDPTHGQLILTDMISAQGEFTLDDNIEQHYSPTLIMAMSFKLASVIAPMITGGDPYKLGDRALKLYEAELSKAMTNALNEEQPEEEPESEMIRARNGWTGTGGPRGGRNDYWGTET